MTVPSALANAAVSGLASVLTGREAEIDLQPSAPMPTAEDAVAYAPPASEEQTTQTSPQNLTISTPPRDHKRSPTLDMFSILSMHYLYLLANK